MRYLIAIAILVSLTRGTCATQQPAISDPDLRPYLQVALAGSLLGIDPEVHHTIRYSAVNGIREIW